MNLRLLLRICCSVWLCLAGYFFTFFHSYGQLFPQGKQAYSVQMHLHAHSHHNGADKPASMQWHAHYANQFNQNVLWWTDHDEVLNLNRILNYNFSSTTNVDSLGNVVNMNGAIDRPIRLEAVMSGGQFAASVQNKILTWQLTGTTAKWDSFGYVPRGTFGKLMQFRMPRPISSQAMLKLVVEPFNFNANTKHQIIVELSWHFQQKPVLHKIIYTLVPDSVSLNPINQGDSLAYIYVPCKTTRDTILLNLLTDASLLLDGDDNTITDIHIQLLAKNGQTAKMTLYYFELYSNAPQPQNQINQMGFFGNRYGARYGHKEIVGIEFATGPNSREYHLNGFVPSINIRDSVLYGDSMMRIYPDSFARNIQNAGGVVSFNHPFGTSSYLLDPDIVQDSNCNNVALKLLQNQVFGCNIIEIGSYSRGGTDLSRHTRLWDILTANKLYLYGNGSFDSHGGAWYDMMAPNSMSTWVWADDDSPESLIDGLKNGRIYFGSPFRYNGRFNFWVGSAQMGDRTTSNQIYDTLSLSFDPLPVGSKVYVYQGLINSPGTNVNYLLFKDQINPYSKICLDLQNPCFIRIEVYDISNRCILLSNPIVFHTVTNQIAQHCTISTFEEQPRVIVKPNQGTLELYPGDFQKSLTIHICNSMGQVVWEKHLKNSVEYQIMLSEGFYSWEYKSIASGIYFVQFLKDGAFPYTQKVILLND
ncbi:MAG: hypothetical protein LC115_05840 [Bacteroidia bacterium]|nr:hypothetical protein [Bacteroidia bacterium]